MSAEISVERDLTKHAVPLGAVAATIIVMFSGWWAVTGYIDSEIDEHKEAWAHNGAASKSVELMQADISTMKTDIALIKQRLELLLPVPGEEIDTR